MGNIDNYKDEKMRGSDDIISLLNTYLLEWSHRDQLLWSQMFKFYYANLIIILLPNITEKMGIELPNIPIVMYRIIGLIISFVFLYVSLGYAFRLQAISDTCQDLISKLPKSYQRKKIDTLPMGKFFSLRLSYFGCFALFVSLVSLSIILIVF